MQDPNDLMIDVLLRVVPVLLVWLLCIRFGRDWLKAGHGPLWYAASCAVIGIGAWLSTADRERLLVRLYALIIKRSVLNQLHLALALLIALFVAGRVLFGLGRWLMRRHLERRGERLPPVPKVFLWAGIAPDGSPLVRFRTTLWALLGISLAAATLAILAMEPGQDYTPWTFSYAALLGLLLGATHPAEPVRHALADPPEAAPAQAARAVDLSRLHAALGNPAQIEVRPAVSPQAADLAARRSRLGLEPYPFQTRICADGDPVLALSGPHGSGRTSGALMAAVDLALGSGRTAAFITPTAQDAAGALELARRRLRLNPAGVGLMLERGSRLQNGDLWFVGLDELEAFLNEQQDLVRHTFVKRLELAVIEDVEQLSGVGVPRARFLLHRLLAATEAERVRLVVTGNLPHDVLLDVARLITTQSPEVLLTSGAQSREGARSLPVRRFVVDPGVLKSPELLDIARDAQRIIESDQIDGELLGDPWAPWRNALAPEASPEVVLAHVGPRTAWRVLAHPRFYAAREGAQGSPEGPSEVREYLIFDTDPMSQLIRREFDQSGRWWPQWYDTRRFPRVLSATPGGLHTPAGLEYEARHQLRAALDEAPQQVARLEAVYSPRIAAAELSAMRSRGLSARVQGWKVNPEDPGRPALAELARTTGAASAVDDLEAMMERNTIVLRDPATHFTHKIPSEIIDLLYFPDAIVSLRGQRYRVQHDPREPRERLLKSVGNQDLETAPIRRLRVIPRGEDMVPHQFRFQGPRALEIFRGRVELQAEHWGVRDFSNQHRRRMDEKRGRAPLTFRVVTAGWIVCTPGATEVALHTLTHVLRELLDHFFHGASKAIGVTYEVDFMNRAGLVFYDLHPQGLGCLNDVDDRQDLGALLEAAWQILSACDCERACTRCAESMTCTSDPHQDKLDRHAALSLLDALLRGRR